MVFCRRRSLQTGWETWCSLLLPYLEERAAYAQGASSRHCFSQQGLGDSQPTQYKCPSRPSVENACDNGFVFFAECPSDLSIKRTTLWCGQRPTFEGQRIIRDAGADEPYRLSAAVRCFEPNIVLRESTG